jgi:surface antigen
VISVAVMAVAISPFTYVSPAKADKFDAQIEALEQEIKQYNKEASKLKNKRATLETQLFKLSNEKRQIQAKLDLSVAKANKLKQEIATNESKIQDNKSVLGDTIADLYIDSDISPLEMLASSDNIADYVDKQANQEQVQNTLQNTIDKIDKLKKQLEKQKKEVDGVIADQKYTRQALVKKENEKQSLISQTRGKESAFQKLSSKSAQQKRQLEQQQQAAIASRLASYGGGGGAVTGSSSKGGYPNNLASAPMDSLVDPWGMYNRECVSYTAWKVYQKNGQMPYWGGVGNANQWPGNARAAGIGTGSTPKKGAVGIISAGQYGHSVFVESVNSDGTVNISQYNEFLPNGGGWGQYSERYNVNPATYDTYIYF